jgi:hypothetical protein
MPLQLDHVFVCCDAGAPEAAVLLEHGIREGTSNVHPGQGTANRRFFFDNGFLELLWVTDPAEAQNPLTRRTRLWERWSGRASGACPFGVAFRPSGAEVDAPPFPVWSYKPIYLPDGRHILFADVADLREPELFYLAWPATVSSTGVNSTQHPVPLQSLVSVNVGLPYTAPLSDAASAALSAGLVVFHESASYELIMKFESPVEVLLDLRPVLPVVLLGSPSAQPNRHAT